jgi:hypothetical protein
MKYVADHLDLPIGAGSPTDESRRPERASAGGPEPTTDKSRGPLPGTPDLVLSATSSYDGPSGRLSISFGAMTGSAGTLRPYAGSPVIDARRPFVRVLAQLLTADLESDALYV